MDVLTILRTFSQRKKLRKRWKSADDFTLVASYDEARWFRHETIKVADLLAWGKALKTLQKDERACLIQGLYLPDDVLAELGKDDDGEPRALKTMSGERGYRRIGLAMREEPHHLMAIDVDGWACAEDWLASKTRFRETVRDFVESELPPEWSELDFVAQATASAMKEAGMLRCRLFAWCDEPVGLREMRAFLKGLAGSWRDPAIYTTTQPIYTALPTFEKGGDPWREKRLVWVEGGVLGTLPRLDVPSEARALVEGSGSRLSDPGADESLAGAFCRVKTLQDVLDEHLGHIYEPADGGRYHLIGSPERAGLILYDGGWGYSHHAGDPTREMFRGGDGSPRPFNAFDLLVLACEGNKDKAAELAKDVEEVRMAVRGVFGEVDEIDPRIQRAQEAARKVGPYELDASTGQGWKYEPSGFWAPYPHASFDRDLQTYRSDLNKKAFEEMRGAAKLLVTRPRIEWAGSDLVGLEDAAYRLNGWDLGHIALEKVEHGPQNRLTTIRPWAWDDTVGEPTRWLTFLDEVFDGDEERVCDLRWWLGYNLIRDYRYQRIAVFQGKSRSGKGVVTRVLHALLGDEGFAGVQMNSLASSPHITSLFSGKLALVVGDAHALGARHEYQKVKEFLQSVSGGDAVEINPKNRPLFYEHLSCRITMVCNEVPRFPDSSAALPNRYLVVPFDQSFAGREIPGLENRLLEELPQIWRWAFEGLAELGAAGGFRQSAAGARVLGEVRQEANPIETWFREEIEVCGDPEIAVSKAEIYASYRQWCTDNGFRPHNQVWFGRTLKPMVEGALEGVGYSGAYPDTSAKVKHPRSGKRVDGYRFVRLSGGEGENTPTSPTLTPTDYFDEVQ